MRYFSLLTLLILACLVMGCNQDVTEPSQALGLSNSTAPLPAQIQTTLERQMATLQANRSASLIGDQQDAVSLTGYDVYALIYLWGRLTNAADMPSQTTDWTGRLTTNAAGHMVPLTGLFFEEGQDSLVPTNANIHVAWVSFTENDFDGVAALMFVERDAIYITPPTLVFDTGPFFLELPIHELDLFFGYYPVDDVNSVAVHARRIFSNDCPGGLLEGEWVRADIGGLTGTFHGLWLDHDGDPEGYFNCLFWTTSDGNHLFSGQLSGYDTDQVIADLNGIWNYDDYRLCPMCGSSHGWFNGRYVNWDGTPGGTIEGVFGDYDQPPEENVLPLSGVRQRDCPVISNATVVPAAK